ncbi:TetR/AcrR family transcriptional regulator [Frankia sp. Mgl5]|uniref:TetR/AcrR family transcriptional regulator n=1 Tax=Frankia sp. Mgl5 TaxID=2933793 RepID=UPI00200F2A85|nr:TetR/AcrR family transcriptional regulator [Frankia sp. Mgl5]MCK9926298.1 TetR/AcrR family transcriptional regulator [Frankia sp. Mgl5]
MRTHGWGGDPPETDAEATARIIAAAVECLRAPDAGADLAKVAVRLGITRQTVYRYFPSRDALFAAVAAERAEALVARLAAHLTHFSDPREALVEAMLHCVRMLPTDPLLSFIARPGRADALITTPDAPELTLDVLNRLPVDLGHLDVTQRALLAEHMVRLLQSLLLDEATGQREDCDLRRFLHACLDHHLAGQTIHS